MKRVWIGLVLSVLVLGGGFLAYRKAFKAPSVQVLESATVERGSIRGVLVETGILKPQVGAVVKIGARITGTVVSMKVKIGDPVEAGQLIALIDDRELRRSIDRQKAALESARWTLDQVELTYPQRIKEAEANQRYARANYEREQKLMEREFTTGDALDRARSQFEALEANVKRLRDEYRTQLQISGARVEELEAQLKQLEVSLSYTRIHAPIDGVVSDVTIQEGETIVTGLQVANLVTILDTSRLEMWIYVDETNIGRVQVDQAVEFYVDTFPDQTFHGRIQRVHPQPINRDNIVYYLAIVQLTARDAEVLKPEMTTHVRIIYEQKDSVLTAPNAALKFEEGRQVAYVVVGENRVEKTDIKSGVRGEDRTEIQSGLREGDRVATKIILPAEKKP
ncbi:MAG: efflux RND transporter periplasmic adaptor subunit [Syntrophobacteraceae bacterium]|nr:efflux RND transporter periplasmic adaptor subunit [Syntrophobacteraceae bacterium]